MNYLQQVDELKEIDDILRVVKKHGEKIVRGKGLTFYGLDNDDVVQEIMIKVFQKYNSYDSTRSKLSTFIGGIINKVILECLDASKKNKPLSTSEDIFDESKSEVRELSYASSDYDLVEVLHDIDLIVDETSREVVHLRVCGFTFREISEMVGINPMAAHRAWKRFVEEYTS